MLVMLIATALQAKFNYDSNVEEINARFQVLLKSYQSSITTNLWLLDEVRLQTLLDGNSLQPDFQYAAVILNNNKIVASSGNVTSKNVIKITTDLTHHFRGKNTLIGKFELVASQDGAFQHAYQEFWRNLTSNAIIIILLAGAIYVAVHRLIIRHLESMADYTRQFSMANINHALDLGRSRDSKGNDELHELENSFNQMRERLKTYYDSLRLLNAELENRVTERTSALTKSESQLNEAQSLAHLGNWSRNIATGEEFWSDEQYKIFGLTPGRSTISFDDFQNALHPDDKPSVLAALEETLNGTHEYDTKFRIIRPNGEIRTIHARGEVARNPQGEPERIYGTVLDITLQKQIEDQYRHVLTHLADGTITINTKGIIEYVNPMTETMFGYSAVEMIGSNVSMITPEPHRSQHDGYLEKYLETGKSTIIGIGRQVNAMRKDGTVFPVDLNVSEMTLDGKTTFFGTVRDMTDRVKAEGDILQAKKSAEAANQAKSNFLSSMSHELRTPMNAILGFAQLLENDPAQPLSETQLAYTRQILKGGDHLLDLIEQVLELSKIESGSISLLLENVAPENVIAESLTLVKTQADDKEIELKFLPPDFALPNLKTDQTRFHQVLLSILMSLDERFLHRKLLAPPRSPLQLLIRCFRSVPVGVCFLGFVDGCRYGLVVVRQLTVQCANHPAGQHLQLLVK